MKSAGEVWRVIQKGAELVYFSYGHTYATLYASDVRYRTGPPFVVSLDLNSNLKGRSETGQMVDARDLLDGGLAELHYVQFAYGTIGEKITAAFSEHGSEEMELHIEMSGHHVVSVRGEVKNGTLHLRAVK